MSTKSISWYRNRVKLLRSKHQPVQRSIEWFEARNTRITASEAACCLTLSEEICKQYVEDFNIKNFKYKPDSCLSHYDNREDYIIKKCKAFYGESVFTDSIYTLHGKKFEEIAARLYRIKFNTDIIEFGLLNHSKLNYIAASPDGITPDGVMIEIKCPYSRKIKDGIPPIWYWVQMQIQLEVANLDRCDFLECQIEEISHIDFINIKPNINQSIGILLNNTLEDDNSETKYIYPPDNLDTCDDFLNWSQSTITQHGPHIIPIYFFINKWAIIKVFRRQEWFNYIKPLLKKNMILIKNLQSDPELFKKYIDSIYIIRNKEYIENYNNTVCIVDSDNEDDFIINKDTSCLLSSN